MVLLTLALVSCSIVLAVIYVVKNLKTSPQLKSLLINSEWKLLELPPGPRPLPILGNMHLLGKYEVPFQAFNDLKEIYGDIFQLTLGSFQCIVVNNYQLIKEVLITKGAIFGGRPDFKRFHKLFGDDRSNCKSAPSFPYLHSTDYFLKNLGAKISKIMFVALLLPILRCILQHKDVSLFSKSCLWRSPDLENNRFNQVITVLKYVLIN